MFSVKKILNITLSVLMALTGFHGTAHAGSTAVVPASCHEVVSSETGLTKKGAKFTNLAEAGYLESINEELFEDTDMVRLVRAQILHSRFFEYAHSLVDYEDSISSDESSKLGFKFKTPKQIYDLTDEKTDILAVKIYEVMERKFTLGTDLPLADSKWSRKVFQSMSREIVIDKIGENLIVIGKEDKFVDADWAIKSRSDINFYEGMGYAIGGLGSSFSLGTALGSWDIMGLLMLGEYWAMVGGSAGVIALSLFTQFRRKDKAPETIVRARLRTHQKYVNHSSVDRGNRYNSENLEEVLSAIKTRAMQLKEGGRVPVLDDLTLFGDDAVKLQAELGRAFHGDLMRWFSIHAQHAGTVRQIMEELKEGNISLSGARSSAINFLEKVLREGIEATKETQKISRQIVNIIQSDFKKVKELQLTENGNENESENFPLDPRMQQTDKDNAIDYLRLAKVTHGSFVENLVFIHKTLSKLLAHIRALELAESAGISNSMSGKVKQTIVGINNELDVMDELYEYFRIKNTLMDGETFEGKSPIIEGNATEVEE